MTTVHLISIESGDVVATGEAKFTHPAIDVAIERYVSEHPDRIHKWTRVNKRLRSTDDYDILEVVRGDVAATAEYYAHVQIPHAA